MTTITENEIVLKKEHARKRAKWFTKSVMYQIYLRSFTPEGTLKAATLRLSKLADMGVDIIYICPICVQDDDMRTEFWSPRHQASGISDPENPYRIKDYYNIDPEYGTDEDLHMFIKAAHKLDMRVLLDIVFYHCGPTAVFIDEHPDFVKHDENGEIAKGTWNFPILNFECEELREYLWKNLEYWMKEFSVDGYRCDVSDLVPIDFWEKARRRLEAIKADVIILSEGGRKEDQLFAFDLNYNFPLKDIIISVFDAKTPPSAIRETCTKMSSERPKGTRFIRYIDNHDMAHETRDNRIDNAWGINGVNAALVLIFTLDGIPFLYNGQEVADQSPNSLYGKFPINWNNGETEEGKKREAFCSELCAMRHSNTILADGELEWLDNDNPDQVLSFLRILDGKQILVAINLTNQKAKTRISIPTCFASPVNHNGINNQNIKLENHAQNAQKDLPNKNALVHIISNEACCATLPEEGMIELSFGEFGYFVGKC